MITEMTRSGTSLDEAEKALAAELLLPIPGRQPRNVELLAEQEMEMFKSAQATMGR